MAKYLVTGGAGFIGSNVARELLRRGHYVRIIDNLSTGQLRNLEGIQAQVDFRRGDITSIPDIRKASRGMDFILHQAAVRSIRRSVEQPRITHRVNTTGTLNVLLAARDAGVRRVVFASSSSVYGLKGGGRNVETQPTEPQSPYAVTKLLGEHYCRVFFQVYGLPTVILRYFNVFGPYQDPQSKYAAVIPILVSRTLAGKPLFIEWHGQQSRDFTYVDNVVQANIKATTSNRVRFGQLYNIGSGQNTSINTLRRLIQANVGIRTPVVHRAKRSGDIYKTHANINRARRELGYKPAVRFEAGLVKYIDWYKKNRQQAR